MRSQSICKAVAFTLYFLSAVSIPFAIAINYLSYLSAGVNNEAISEQELECTTFLSNVKNV